MTREAECVWISKRLRYRNRKGYSTARRYGIPRSAVGAGLSLVVINGSMLFTRVTVRATFALDPVYLEMEDTGP